MRICRSLSIPPSPATPTHGTRYVRSRGTEMKLPPSDCSLLVFCALAIVRRLHLRALDGYVLCAWGGPEAQTVAAKKGPAISATRRGARWKTRGFAAAGEQPLGGKSFRC